MAQVKVKAPNKSRVRVKVGDIFETFIHGTYVEYAEWMDIYDGIFVVETEEETEGASETTETKVEDDGSEVKSEDEGDSEGEKEPEVTETVEEKVEEPEVTEEVEEKVEEPAPAVETKVEEPVTEKPASASKKRNRGKKK